MKFRINRDVEQASGVQVFEVEADSTNEAYQKFKVGEGDIVDHEVEVTHLSRLRENEIYEYQN